MSTNGVNIAEDADMAECDEEKVVTMMDVLQEQQEFEDDANAVLGASDDKNCTYAKGYIKRQAIYACLTCCVEAKDDPLKRAGVCLACSLNCHENHELIELYTKRNFRCDCGNPKFNSHPCQFVPEKPDLNEDNSYNQNFNGIYCTCHRPYPDPEATFEDEMIQCIVCEDWLHAAHLETSLPTNEYAEMICKACMEKNEFLHSYSEIAVNNETEDVDVLTVNKETSILNNTSECNGVIEKVKGGADVEMAETEASTNSESVTTEIVTDVPNAVDSTENIVDKNVPEVAKKIDEANETRDSEPPKVETAKTTDKPSNKDSEDEKSTEPIIDSTSNSDNTSEPNIDNEESPQENEESPKEIEESSKEIEESSKEIEESSKEIKESPKEIEESPKENEESPKENIEIPKVSEEDKITEAPTSTETEDKNNDNSIIESIEKLENELGNVESTEKKDNEVLGESKETTETKTEEDDKKVSTDVSSSIQEKTEAEGGDNTVEKAVENVGSDSKEENYADAIEKDSSDGVPCDSSITEENGKKEIVENGISEETPSELTDSEPKTEIKRKLSTEEPAQTSKKPKLDDTSCIRPKEMKKRFKGATFWPSNFRQKLCTCNACISMYKDLSVLFLMDPEDTVTAYEALGREKNDGTATSQYEKGLEALTSLGRIQQINALTEYNKMRDKLLDFLKSFKDRKEIVKEEDIKAFFAGMKPKRESDGVYFCR